MLPQYFQNYKELVRKSVLCPPPPPPNIEALIVPSQSQSCSTAPATADFVRILEYPSCIDYHYASPFRCLKRNMRREMTISRSQYGPNNTNGDYVHILEPLNCVCCDYMSFSNCSKQNKRCETTFSMTIFRSQNGPNKTSADYVHILEPPNCMCYDYVLLSKWSKQNKRRFYSYFRSAKMCFHDQIQESALAVSMRRSLNAQNKTRGYTHVDIFCL